MKRASVQVNYTVMTLYLIELQKSVENVAAENIVNCDETNFSEHTGMLKVLTKRGAKHCDCPIAYP